MSDRTTMGDLHTGDVLTDQAKPLVALALDVIHGDPLPTELLGQAALGMSLQACVRAALAAGPLSTRDVVGAFATAYAAWATTVADDKRELEDALVAFVYGVRKIGPGMIAKRRAS